MKKWNILTRAILPALALLALSPSAYAALYEEVAISKNLTRLT